MIWRSETNGDMPTCIRLSSLRSMVSVSLMRPSVLFLIYQGCHLASITQSSLITGK